MTDERWPNDRPGASTDWIEYTLSGRSGTDGEDLLRFRVNVSFLLSKWTCIFGQGCPSVLLTGATKDTGCCQIGVHMKKGQEYKRVKHYVNQLTGDDCDNIDSIHTRGFAYRETDEDQVEQGYKWHTRVVDGACIMSNRAGGATGKVGCALHALANRLDIHPSETKPDICWQIPVAISEEYDENLNQTTVTIDGTSGHVWGHSTTSSSDSPGWWCVESPEAYVADDMVFRTNQYEISKQIGDDAYAELEKRLLAIIEAGGRRYPMPGEVVHNGQPLIPIMVKARIDEWGETGEVDKLRRSQQDLPSILGIEAP